MEFLTLSLAALALLQAPAQTMQLRCPNGLAEADVVRHLKLLKRRGGPVADYPSEALRNEWQGTVAMRLTAGCDGVVVACEIIESSGHHLLDEHACRSMSLILFDPRTNEAGEPVEASYATSKTYSLD